MVTTAVKSSTRPSIDTVAARGNWFPASATKVRSSQNASITPKTPPTAARMVPSATS